MSKTCPDNICALCYHDKSEAHNCTRPDCECSVAPPCSPVRAFRVTCDYWEPPIVSICRVTSPQKARFACWESANEVGYKVRFGQLKVRRAPEYDAAKLIEGRCYGEDYALSILSENVTAQTRTPNT